MNSAPTSPSVVSHPRDIPALRIPRADLAAQLVALVGRVFGVAVYDHKGAIARIAPYRVTRAPLPDVPGWRPLALVIELSGYPFRWSVMPLANWLQHHLNPHPFMDSRKGNEYPAATICPNVSGVLADWPGFSGGEGSRILTHGSWKQWNRGGDRTLRVEVCGFTVELERAD